MYAYRVEYADPALKKFSILKVKVQRETEHYFYITLIHRAAKYKKFSNNYKAFCLSPEETVKRYIAHQSKKKERLTALLKSVIVPNSTWGIQYYSWVLDRD
jgi:hypothetical protein